MINSASFESYSAIKRNLFHPWCLWLCRLLSINVVLLCAFYHVRRKCHHQLKQTQPNLLNMLRLDVKSVQGSLTKEIGFYAERASIHNTPKPKVKAKPSLAIFNPSLFLINPKLAQTSAFDSMTDEFAIVNVKRNGLQHLISPISHCEWDLGFLWRKATADVMSITRW